MRIGSGCMGRQSTRVEPTFQRVFASATEQTKSESHGLDFQMQSVTTLGEVAIASRLLEDVIELSMLGYPPHVLRSLVRSLVHSLP
eukprot:6491092-Amphidinium_carterae.5